MKFRSPSVSRWSAGVLAFAAIALSATMLLSTSPSAEAAQGKKANRFIGAQKCKTCHASKETGDQFGVLAQMKHAHAWDALATEEAKKSAKDKGFDDPQKADGCVKCHVTAFGVPDAEIAKGFDKAMGVQCESCHGPGEAHMKARMAAAADEDPDAPKVYKGLPEGEIVVHPDASVCTTCHNKESPNYQPFCHCKFKEKIRHLNPKRERTEAEKAALNSCGCKDDCACKKECCKEGTCTELAKKK